MRVGRVVAVGIAAGLLSGVFGVGGGILIVPGLMWVASMDQRRAHGTSLAAVLPIAVFGVVTYVANNHVNIAAAAALTGGSLVGTLVGTAWLNRAPKRLLSLSFAALLVFSAARLLFELDTSRGHALTVGSAAALVATGIIAGVLAGLLGIGGGVVMVPAMMLVLGLSPVVAKGTSLAVIVPTAIIGTWRNRRNLNVDMRAAMLVGLGGAGCAVVGAMVADRLPDRASNLLFAGLLLFMALRLIREAGLAMRQKSS
ncbi:MAG: sulfite exporter TauE/SafE family protein [Ilumatobacteraceae bacterium]